MKKVPLIIVVFLSVFSDMFSQLGEIELSPEYKLAKNKILISHLHSDDSGHYMYFKKYKVGILKKTVTFVLEKYDNKFQQNFSKEFKVDKNNIYGLSMKYFKNKFAWLMYEKNKDDNYLEFFLTPIDLNGESSKPKTIAKFKYERFGDFPNIGWGISKDTSKILFIAENDRDKKKENYEVYLSVIDPDFNIIWEKKVKLPYSQRRLNMKSWEVSNDGKVYFVTKIYDDNRTNESEKKVGKKKKRKNNRRPAYDMVIYSIDEAKDKPSKYELKLRDAFGKGLRINIEDSGDLACVGFFGDSRYGPTQGAFCLKLSVKDESIIFANKRRFTPKELVAFGNKNTSKDRKTKDSGLDPSFSFDEIVVRDDGGILATAEENYIYTREEVNLRGEDVTTTYYVSNAIIVINVSPNGEISNVGIIPKKQTMTTSTFGTYAVLRKGDDAYFVYNDDKDNLRKNITDPDKIKKISSARDCVAVMTTLDGKNKMNRKALFTKKEAKTLLMPRKSAQINDNQLFFFNSKPQILGKTKFRFGVLTVK